MYSERLIGESDAALVNHGFYVDRSDHVFGREHHHHHHHPYQQQKNDQKTLGSAPLPSDQYVVSAKNVSLSIYSSHYLCELFFGSFSSFNDILSNFTPHIFSVCASFAICSSFIFKLWEICFSFIGFLVNYVGLIAIYFCVVPIRLNII